MPSKEISSSDYSEFLTTLQKRFDEYFHRHVGVKWADVQARLESQPEKLSILFEMENTGGEPDVVHQDVITGEVVFYDCSPESPKGRRSFCYDREALDARKANKPANNATEAANELGVELLTEEQYQYLQSLGNFDTKTSSWISTPTEIRKLGGAIFGDRRFGRVFIYHNGAESYYAGRGFRGALRV